MTKPDADPPTETDPTRRSRPSRREREQAIDEAIRDAQARGAFDNLPGKGQPLKWETERDDEWWLADHMLKSAGYRPAWIDTDNAIRAEREALAALLAEHLAWHRAHAASEPPGALALAAQQVAHRYRERAAKLNREIDRHNLSVPLPSLQRLRVRVEEGVAGFLAAVGVAEAE